MVAHIPKINIPERPTPGIESGEMMREAGRKVVAFHLARMLKEEKGVRGGSDTETIHVMRVAIRRMRSVMRTLAPFYRRSAIRPLRRHLREVAGALGAVRDLDVFRLKAERYAEQLPRQNSLRPLLDALRSREAEARKTLLLLLDSAEYANLVVDLATFATVDGAKSPYDEMPLEPQRVCEVLPTLIYEQYGLMRAHETLLMQASLDILHNLRIEAKRLRYLLEAFVDVLGDEVKDVIEAAKKLQDHLGDLQDARVAVAMLKDDLETWRGRGKTAIRDYMMARQDEQEQLKAGVNRAWDAFNHPDIRRALALAVSAL